MGPLKLLKRARERECREGVGCGVRREEEEEVGRMKHVAAYLLVRIISSVSLTASLWLRSVRAFFFRCAPRAPPRAGVGRACVRVCSVVIGGAPGGGARAGAVPFARRQGQGARVDARGARMPPAPERGLRGLPCPERRLPCADDERKRARRRRRD